MTTNVQKINAKAVAKYMLLPGIVPRAKEMGSEGFGYLAFLFANIFQAVRILPPSHAFVQPSNIGKFSIRQVLAAAANNVELSRRNIDQVVIFTAILAAVAILFLQFFFLLFGILTGSAFAQTATTVTWTSMFQTQYPQVDIAFLMLDYVFGIPDLAAGGTTSFFGSNALLATNGPTPFHQGMHALFNFYNLALLLVGVLIFMYYVIVVVIETAQTGVPFGRRFSKLYAPFRLIIAIGLLVPFGYGFNASQYITLYAAKLGSSFATNGWILFNTNLSNPIGADNKSLVARPRFPPSDELLYFSSVYHACREIYAIWSPANYINPQAGTCINAYVIFNNQAIALVPNNSPACQNTQGGGGGTSDYTYRMAKDDFKSGDVEIVLGEYDPTVHTQYAGGVRPYCGKMTVSLNHNNPSIYSYVQGGAQAGPGTWGDQAREAAINATEAIYFDMVKELLRVPGQGDSNATPNIMCASGGQSAGGLACATFNNPTSASNNSNPFAVFGERAAHSIVPVCPVWRGPNCTQDVCWKSTELDDAATCGKPNWTPTSTVFQFALDEARTNRDLKLDNSYQEFSAGLNLKVMADLERRGWGGAGIWYNHIADINGAFTSAIYSAPSVRKWPEIMEFVRSQRQAQDKSIASCDIFDPNLGDNKNVEFRNTIDDTVAKVLNATYKYFNCEKPNQDTTNTPNIPTANVGTGTNNVGGGCTTTSALTTGTVTRGITSNIFIDFVSVVFGLNGLFDLRACSAIDPNTGQSIIHPLAQLATIGKSLVENAIRSMAMAMGAAFGGGMIGMMSTSLGAALNSASGMFVGVATIGLSAGFILYYILPFLPFIYFFFAVGSWVKSIFEAMVGAPLWALAHLRIDGEGLPGSSAVSGYFLIFEIFARPIITVFGLIGGMAVFGAMAVVLNDIFDLVVMNVTGVGPGGSNSTMNINVAESFRRGILDQFFFTVMYAILLYMMAVSSFKMIDTIPKGIMRWMNSRVSTFNDNKGDPTQNLTSYAALSGSQISGQLFGAGQSASKGLGQAIGAVTAEAAGAGSANRGGQG